MFVCIGAALLAVLCFWIAYISFETGVIVNHNLIKGYIYLLELEKHDEKERIYDQLELVLEPKFVRRVLICHSKKEAVRRRENWVCEGIY